MVREVSKERALSVLEERDRLAYRDAIRYLKKGPSRHVTVRALASDSGEILAVCRQFRATPLEVHLLGDKPGEMLEVIRSLPGKELNLFVTGREAQVLKALQPQLSLELVATRRDLHCSQETLVAPSTFGPDVVVRLQPVRQLSLRREDIELEGERYADWVFQQWDIYFQTPQPVFGILSDGRVVSFCSIADDGEISLIYTLKGFRGRGLAKRTLFAATRVMTEQGRLAYYSVDEQNIASMATALSVGYVEHAQQMHYTVEFPDRGDG